MIFKNAYSNPTCSPTRTTIQTGRYAFRTGVGLPGDGFGPREQTIPEVLRSIAPQPSPSYSSAAIGKWHMSTEKQFDACGPVLFGGYDYFIGTETNIGDYCSWRKTRLSRCPGLYYGRPPRLRDHGQRRRRHPLGLRPGLLRRRALRRRRDRGRVPGRLCTAESVQQRQTVHGARKLHQLPGRLYGSSGVRQRRVRGRRALLFDVPGAGRLRG